LANKRGAIPHRLSEVTRKLVLALNFIKSPVGLSRTAVLIVHLTMALV
jgi:hypothetical protein